jgi:hypothetical protein
MDAALVRETEAKCVAMSRLLQSDGWKMFEIAMAQAEQAAYGEMMKAPDAFNAAKHMGAYRVLKDLRDWPRRELQLNTQALQTDLTVNRP